MSNRVKDEGKVSGNTSNVNPPLKKGSKVTVGGASITITDPYGIRSFKGREGQHSTGIDLVTSNGSAVAVADGVIVDVKAQHSGGILDVTNTNLNDPTQSQLFKNASRTIQPTEGQSAGFFVTVKHPDGTYGRYMHLDPIDPSSAKSLIGKQVKRGESLGSYSTTGSGSMVGKHVKFRVFTDLSNSSKSHIDPTGYLLGKAQQSEYQPTEEQQTPQFQAPATFEVVQGAGTPQETYDQFLKELAIKEQEEQKVEGSSARQEVEQKKEVVSKQQQFLQAFANATAPIQENQAQPQQQMQRVQPLMQQVAGIQTSMPEMQSLFQDGGTKDSWGRSLNDKWYGFDPQAKKYTISPYKIEELRNKEAGVSKYDALERNAPQKSDNTRVVKANTPIKTLTEAYEDTQFELNKKKLETDFNKTTQYYEDYHKSPMYKKMLNNSMKTGEDASFFSDNRELNLESLDAPTILRYQPKGKEGTGGWSSSDTGNITVTPEGYAVQGILPHEISHSIDRPINRSDNRVIPGKDIAAITNFKPVEFTQSPLFKTLPTESQDALINNREGNTEYLKKREEWINYVGTPTETRARLNDIRIQSKFKGVYDPFTQQVSPDIYKKLLNTPFEKSEHEGFDALKQLKGVYTDKQIQWMLNNISKNEGNIEEFPYAKNGGTMSFNTQEEYQNGGTKDSWGRSLNDKWYGFNPETKKYTIAPYKIEELRNQAAGVSKYDALERNTPQISDNTRVKTTPTQSPKKSTPLDDLAEQKAQAEFLVQQGKAARYLGDKYTDQKGDPKELTELMLREIQKNPNISKDIEQNEYKLFLEQDKKQRDQQNLLYTAANNASAFLADPIATGANWMQGRGALMDQGTISRDPTNPNYANYQKATGSDSWINQGINLVNPGAWAADARVANERGDYLGAALSLADAFAVGKAGRVAGEMIDGSKLGAKIPIGLNVDEATDFISSNKQDIFQPKMLEEIEIPKTKTPADILNLSNLPKATISQLEDLKGFLPRRQFIKNLQDERLIGKEFNTGDLNYAARSKERTDALTKLALERKHTAFRNVSGNIPIGGIGRQNYSGNSFNMNKPALGQDISEFGNMKKANVDFNDPQSIAEYQATHIPLEDYGYRSTGEHPTNEYGFLFRSSTPSDSDMYGDFQFKSQPNLDFNSGDYKDWLKKYHTDADYHLKQVDEFNYRPRNKKEDDISKTVMWQKKQPSTLVGQRGVKAFEIDKEFPFKNMKQLTSEEKKAFQKYSENFKNQYNTGWRGEYLNGGTISFNTQEEQQRGLTGAPEGTTGVFNYPNAEEREFIRTDRDLILFADGREIGVLDKNNPSLIVPPSYQVIEKEFQNGGTAGNPIYQATFDYLNANPYMDKDKPLTIDKLTPTVPTPGQYPKMIKDRIQIAGVGIYQPGDYESIQMPEDYKGLPLYKVNGKIVSIDRDFNKEYLNFYKDEKFLGKDVLYPVYGKGTPYTTQP